MGNRVKKIILLNYIFKFSRKEANKMRFASTTTIINLY